MSGEGRSGAASPAEGGSVPARDRSSRAVRGPGAVDPAAQGQGRGDAAVEGSDSGASGADAVRAALNRARAAAASRPVAPGGGRAGAAARRRRRAAAGTRSGAGPDARDPQRLGIEIERLVVDRGWTEPVAVGGVIGRWESVVGPDVAAHCRPESFTEGVLTVRTDSTAWATQVRLLSPALMGRMAQEVGEGTVRSILVRGPVAPSWRRGLRVAPGSKGPGDTYG